MKSVALMVLASLTTALLAARVFGAPFTREIVLGMAGPLLAVAASWLVVERAHRQDPAHVTGALMIGFIVKMVFFAAYIVLVLRMPGLDRMPFMLSFATYFLALYAAEAVLMGRLARARR